MTYAESQTEPVTDDAPDFFCSVVDSWGALVPYVSVMEALQGRGRWCVLCMPEDLRPLAEAASLPFVTDSTHLKNATRGSKLFETANNALQLLLESRRLIAAWMPNVMRATHDAIEAGHVDPSRTVVVSNSPGLFYLGPFWLEMGFSRFVCLEPYLLFDWLGQWPSERSQFLPAALPSWAGRLAFRGLFGQQGRSLATEFLGRRPTQGFEALRRAIIGQWHMCSPQLIPNPSVILGYCYPSKSGELPPDLDTFLDEARVAGRRIVLFTIGSMNLAEGTRADMVEAFAQAIGRPTNTMGIVLGQGESSGDDVFFQGGFVPYQALFPRLDLIVCHGGSGTTHLALWSGIPMVLVPFVKDQFDWAERLDRLGALVATVPREEFSAERLVTVLDGLGAEAVCNARRVGEVERTRHNNGRDRVVEALMALEQTEPMGAVA